MVLASRKKTCKCFKLFPPCSEEIGTLLPNNQRQHRTLHIHEDVLPYALCWVLHPVSAALASSVRFDSISTAHPLSEALD